LNGGSFDVRLGIVCIIERVCVGILFFGNVLDDDLLLRECRDVETEECCSFMGLCFILYFFLSNLREV